MTSAALAYRAVYQFKAKSLRSGLGKSRVFMKGEYEKVFEDSLLEEDNESALITRCNELIIASVLLDTVRDLIGRYADEYYNRIPIIRKSAYHLAGFVYARQKKSFDDLRNEMLEDYSEGNQTKLRGKDYPARIVGLVSDDFEDILSDFEQFYKSSCGVGKSDVDNLLKDNDFDKEYLKQIDRMIEDNSGEK